MLTYAGRIRNYIPENSAGYLPPPPGFRAPVGGLTDAQAVRLAEPVANRLWLYDMPQARVMSSTILRDTHKGEKRIAVRFMLDGRGNLTVPGRAYVVLVAATGAVVGVDAEGWPKP